jgi:hypothetical protein
MTDVPTAQSYVPPPPNPDIYIAQYEGIVGVHHALEAAFAPLAAGASAPLDVLIPQTRSAASFLLAHHEMESSGLFPGLRRHGNLRSTDLASLAARDLEHIDIHRLADELLATTSALHPHSATIAAQARELVALLAPHTREEELALTPERLREMISIEGLTALGAELEAMRAQLLAKLARG